MRVRWPHPRDGRPLEPRGDAPLRGLDVRFTGLRPGATYVLAVRSMLADAAGVAPPLFRSTLPSKPTRPLTKRQGRRAVPPPRAHRV